MHSPRGEAILQHRRLSNAGPVEGSGFKLFNRRGSGAAAVAAARGGSAAAASGSSSVAASSAAAAAGVVGGGSSNSSSSPALQSPPLGARATSATCTASIIDNQAGQQLPVTPAAVTASTPGAAADQAAAAATQDCQDSQAAQAAANLGRTRSAIPSTSLTPSLGSSSRWYSQGILGPVTAPAGGATGSSSSRRGSVDAAGVDSAKAVRRNSRGGVPGSSGSSGEYGGGEMAACVFLFGNTGRGGPPASRTHSSRVKPTTRLREGGVGFGKVVCCCAYASTCESAMLRRGSRGGVPGSGGSSGEHGCVHRGSLSSLTYGGVVESCHCGNLHMCKAQLKSAELHCFEVVEVAGRCWAASGHLWCMH
jgi:hypothetical protein